MPVSPTRPICGRPSAALTIGPLSMSRPVHRTGFIRPSAAAPLHSPTTGVMSFLSSGIEVRYSSVIDAAVATGLQTLSAAARVAYSTANGTGQVQSVSNSEALAVFADPWQLQSLNIKPTTQGSRAIYNTIVIILILIQEFFYLGTINGLSVSFSIFLKLHPSRIIVVRNLNSLSYTLVGSLCTSGAIWAFRSGWDVGGGQFMLTWIALWLFAHLNFLTLDTFTSWLPAPYVPMALIAWDDMECVVHPAAVRAGLPDSIKSAISFLDTRCIRRC